MAAHLAVAPWAPLFDKIGPEAGEGARRLAGILERRFPFHLRKVGKARRPEWGEASLQSGDLADRIAPLVRALEAGELRPEGFGWAVDAILGDPEVTPDVLLDRFRIRVEDAAALPGVVEEVVEKAREMKGRPPGTLRRWAMGKVMGRFFGRIDPRGVKEAIQERMGDMGEEVVS
jgi:Asp-tRNA(Asn)/Glu-tRNA(Gln) amidotransferase B subunit